MKTEEDGEWFRIDFRIILLVVLAILTAIDFVKLISGYVNQKATTGIELQFNHTLTSPRLTICLPLVPDAILRDGKWPSKEEIVDILNNHPLQHANTFKVRYYYVYVHGCSRI